jgi:7,8-dihydropterin-6-yl-methyl-4-(beta-D-ribofuranosyl)aminobenzene 5'-phosphate synthase
MGHTVRVSCVVDDAVQPGSLFRSEHGLAFLIEIDGKRVLYDTGQTGPVLLHNLELLSVEPESIDAVALSHAHYDHTGGLPMLLAHVRRGTPLYASPELFRGRFTRRDGKLKTVGLSLNQEELAAHLVLRLSAMPQKIIPGVWTTGEISERPEPEGKSDYHLMREGDSLIADSYQDDMALVLDLGDRLSVLCGCCHAGLINTLAHVTRTFEGPITVIAGGLHLLSVSTWDLGHIGEVLAAMPALQYIFPNHCTGEGALAALTQILGPSVVRPCPAGSQFDLEVTS